MCIRDRAFVDPESEQGEDVRNLRNQLASELNAPIALGWGPRYLHSTGQLHKGGPALGLYLQIVDTDVLDLPIPGKSNGIAELMQAQARGDREVLASRGRTVLAVE